LGVWTPARDRWDNFVKMLERFWLGCGHCTGEESCPMLQEAARSYECNAWFQGRTLVATAIAIFIVPLATCVAGAALLPRWAGVDSDAPSIGGWQTLGAVGGLVVGMFLAKVLVHLSGVARRASRTENVNVCSAKAAAERPKGL
jgi:hypothetical protein